MGDTQAGRLCLGKGARLPNDEVPNAQNEASHG